MNNDYQKILYFWFKEIDKSLWFKKDTNFDQTIKRRFSQIHLMATQGELAHWRNSSEGRLAEIIILDQFSRNMFRDKPEAFAYDAIALTLAQEAIRVGADKCLSNIERSFLYMPYMHSESKLIHKQAVEIFKELGNEDNLKFELAHKKIIDQFGRYPHRNKILGRISSQAEIDFSKRS